jgi:hypothetical protein
MPAPACETIHPMLSAAVVAYLGLGTSDSPRRNARAVETINPDPDLILATRAVINTVLNFDTDYVFDTSKVQELVTAHTRDTFPALSETAVEAIVWNYTHGWR